MKEQIPLLDRIPFKGITTIQLFDKDTGKEVQKVVHKNTYNQRLMYFTYLNEILSYGGESIPISLPLVGSWRKAYNIRYGASRTYNEDWPIFEYAWNGSSAGTDLTSSTPYACLFLTNGTGAASASGYPDGVPVAIAPLTGVSTQEPTNTQMGRLNTSESYVGNDRAHMVIDFDTASGNCTFDSLWIYPGTKWGQGASGSSQMVNTVPFYAFTKVSASSLNTSIEKASTEVFNARTPVMNVHDINEPYVAVICSGTYSSTEYTYDIKIYNRATDAIVAHYNWTDPTTTPAMLVCPLYYDPVANNLYGLQNNFYASSAYGYNFITSHTGTRMVINLTTGEFLKDTANTFSDIFGMTLEQFNFSSGGGCSPYFIFAASGNVYCSIRVQGIDVTTGNTTRWYCLYQLNVGIPSATLICRFQFPDSSVTWVYDFLIGNRLFINFYVSNADTTTYVVNILNGNIIEQKTYYRINALFNSDSITQMATLLGRDANGTIHYPYNPSSSSNSRVSSFDLKVLNTAYDVSRNISGNICTFTRNKHVNAIWTTHNHLDTPITKTNQTTMKIQYDIIWDSVSDTIIPAIL